MLLWHYICDKKEQNSLSDGGANAMHTKIVEESDCQVRKSVLKTGHRAYKLKAFMRFNNQTTGVNMKLPHCANCKSFLCFFKPERQESNKFFHRCDACGVVNELAIDASSSGESKAVFIVCGIMP
jgi:hypothetical protein